MKKSLIIALAMFALAACKNMGGNSEAGSETTTEGQKVETVYDIAYISMDSLVTNYNRYKDLSGEFETKATKIQSDLEARARRLENEVLDFQEKIGKGLMTRSAAEEQQVQIERRGQQFETDRQNQLSGLSEEQQVMTNQIMYAIQQYVEKYNSDYRYKMILTTSGSAPIMHADPALNITGEILRGLNEEYAAEKAAAAK